MRRSLALVCLPAAIFAPLVVIACSSSPPGTAIDMNEGNGNSGASSGAGNGGSGTNANGTSGTAGGSGNGNNGSTGSPGAGSTGNGSGGNATAGNGSGNGTSSGSGGGSGMVSPIDAGASQCGKPTSTNVLSDFEQDSAVLINSATSGWWYVYADPMSGMQTPASSNGPIAVASTTGAGAPTGFANLAGETCNKFALHSTASGHTQYTGFGATFIPNGTSKTPFNLTSFDGIQFDIATGSSSSQPVYFEVLTKETQPTTLGGSINPNDTANTANPTVAINNNRGLVLTAAGGAQTSTSPKLSSSVTTVYVPFSLLIPRHFPQPGPNGCGQTKVCEAPVFTPQDSLGFQFSAYPDMLNTNGSYDIWVDNVQLYTGDNGLNPANPGMAPPMFNDGAAGITAACKSAIPSFANGTKKAAGKYLLWAYNNWKNRFVSGSPGSARKVIRPEDGNDTVSEGIGYGMILAVYFNDQALFDDLWSYEQQNKTSGNLMTWCIPAGGNSCSASGGTATDADEDMAFALIEAGKRWNGSYAGTASALIGDIAAHDIDWAANLPTGGSNFGNASSKQTNPSYFAPAYYRIFAGIDSAHNWKSLADNSISVIASLAGAVGNGHGLVPAWCTGSCTQVGSNGAGTDGIYQYDAHRVPWRVGLDWCWNGTSAAQTYLASLNGFFGGLAASGVDTIFDLYNLTGSAASGSAPNSMSVVGSAGVGAMAGGTGSAPFVQKAWQFVLDGGNRASLDVANAPPYPYSYFNATVGLLTALTMSGNLYPM